MPIKIDLHSNTSHVKVKPVDNTTTVNTETGCSTDKARLEALIKQEVEARVAGDAKLQGEIDRLADHYVDGLSIEEQDNGSIIVSLINDKEEVVDSKTITLTEKIIKSAKFNKRSGKITYTCNDGSIISVDISSLVDDVTELISEFAALSAEMSILSNRVSSAELTLSTLTDTTIPGIQSQVGELSSAVGELSINVGNLSGRVDNVELTLSEATDRLDVLEPAVAEAIVNLSIINEELPTKLDKDLTGYESLIPKDLTPDQTREMLIYVSNNGIPSYAKLNELGYVRIRDYNSPEDLAKVDSGDLLIDME